MDALTREFLYYLFHIIAAIVTLIVCFLISKNFPIKKAKIILGLGIIYVLLYGTLFVLGWAVNGFKNWGSKNVVRGIIFLPLISFLICKILKINFKHMNNLISILIGIATSITHIGCIFAGCCVGYPSNFGIFNFATNRTVFPATIILILFELGLGLLMLILNKKNNFNENFPGYSLMMIFFGFGRFLIEFLMDEEPLFLGIHEMHLWSLGIFIVGVVWTLTTINCQHNLKKEGAN